MAETAALEALRFCTFCPNLCRSAWPATSEPQIESVTPSALARLALAAVSKRVAVDAATSAALRRTDMAAACRSACPYGHDIAALVASVAALLES